MITLVVLALPAMIVLKVLWDTRGICFFSGNNSTDNEKVVRMASEIKLLNWPSLMHRIPYGRGQLREYWVLGLRVLGFFYRNRITDHLNVALALVSQLGSCILVYFISAKIVSGPIALVVALIYSTSLWPYQVAIFMGHVHLAQFLFLASIYLLQVSTAAEGMIWMLTGHVISGVFCGASFVSSSASRKYPPLYILAFLAIHRKSLFIPWQTQSDWLGALGDWQRITYLVCGLAVLGVLFVALPYLSRHFVVYLSRSTHMGWDSDKQEMLTLKVLLIVRRVCIFSAIAAVLCFAFLREGRLLLIIAATATGTSLVALHVLLPNLWENLNRYRVFLNIGVWANHFKAYKGRELEVFGRPIPENFRGAGFTWVPRYLWRMIPVACVFYVASLLCYVTIGFFNTPRDLGSLAGTAVEILFFIFLSLLPIYIAESTYSLQVGKAYFSSFLALLIIIAKGLESLSGLLDGHATGSLIFWTIIVTLLGAQCLHSLYYYFSDVLPARMGPTYLRNTLLEKKLRAFSTYSSSYNDCFVGSMLYSYPDDFEVTVVESMQSSPTTAFVVPPTSSKSVTMETQQWAIQNGDFDEDPRLNELFKDHKIDKIALARFKTMGASRFYVHESEITSYRDLILHQIGPEDRWRSHGWLITIPSVRRPA